MQVVGLKQLRLVSYAVEQEVHQRCLAYPGHVAIDAVELRRVGSEVRRQALSDDEYFGPLLLRAVGHGQEIGAQGGDGQAAQAVIATQGDDHDVWLMLRQRRVEATATTAAGFSRDTGVDDGIIKPLVVTSATLPGGANFTYGYDGHHNVTSATSATNVASSFSYDQYGNMYQAKVGPTSKPIESNAQFNTSGNLIASLTNTIQKTTTFGYDALGRPSWVKNPLDTDDTKANMSYDSMNRINLVTKKVNHIFTSTLPVTVSNDYTYENDRIKTITHHNTWSSWVIGDSSPNLYTTYNYDYSAFGLPQSVQVGGRTLITNEYDPTNRIYNLIRATYGNSQYVQYSYDSNNRVIGIRFNGDTTDRFTFAYDNCGALARIQNISLDMETCMYYDFTGRLMKVIRTRISDPSYQWHGYRYEYDDYGRLSKFYEDTGELNNMQTDFVFDQDGRISQQTEGSCKYTWAYDAYGRVTSRVNYYNNVSVLTTIYTYYEPDSTHTSTLPASVTQSSSAGYTRTYNYTYDDNGNLALITDHNGNRIRCRYNELNQLIRLDDEVDTFNTYVYYYDMGGNILSVGYLTAEFADELTDYPWTDSSYQYTDTQGWGDLLSSYNYQALTYDEISTLR